VAERNCDENRRRIFLPISTDESTKGEEVARDIGADTSSLPAHTSAG